MVSIVDHSTLIDDNSTLTDAGPIDPMQTSSHASAWRLDNIMTTRKRHSPEQIMRKLATADRLLAKGMGTAAVCRELGVSEATYYRWRNQFGGLKADDAKRLKDLERENARLTRRLADAELEMIALKEIAKGNF